MNILYLVMPAYNEEANIEAAVDAWYPVLLGKDKQSRMVVADSGSTDATHRILLNLKEKYPQLEILSNTGRRHGSKVIALYDYAIKQGADFIFQTDSDGQTNPEEFPSFWELGGRYDVVIGCRTIREDGKIRAFVEKVVCFLLWLYFGVKVPDANAPFRLMKTAVVEKYLGRLPADYSLPNIMMTAYFSYYGESLYFQDITFRPRQGGVNTVNLPKILKIGCKAMSDFWNFRKGMLR